MATGVGSEVVQQLSANRMQAQLQQLLTGLTETRSALGVSPQQPVWDQATVAIPSQHDASSQQASAAQASVGGAGAEHIARRLPQLPQGPEVAQDGSNSSAADAPPSQHPAAATSSGDTASRMEAQLPDPPAAGPPPESSAVHSRGNSGPETAAPMFQLPPPRLLASAVVQEDPRVGAAAEVPPHSPQRGIETCPAERGDAARLGAAPAWETAPDLHAAGGAPRTAHAAKPEGQVSVRVLSPRQPDSSERTDSVRDVAVQQDACQNIKAHPTQAEADQDDSRGSVPTHLTAGEDLDPSKDTHSVDVGGPSCLQLLQLAGEPTVARTPSNDTATIDIVGSATLGSAQEGAANCTLCIAFHADTASIDIIGSGVSRTLRQGASGCDAAQAGKTQVAGTCSNSEAAAVLAISIAPSQDSGKRKIGDDLQREHPAAATSEAGRQVKAASARKRPCGTQQGASSKQPKLQRTLKELDVDPSSSLALSGSEWLPAQPAKTRQQVRASQPIRNLRGRQILIPGISCAAADCKARAISGLPYALIPPPGIAPAAHKQHAQARKASACAQRAAEAMPDHGLDDGEAMQQQPVCEHQANEAAQLQSNALPAVQAERPSPPQTEPQKGSRELHSLLTTALASPGHQAGSASLHRQLASRTRAQSAPQPRTSRVPINEIQRASANELAKSLEAAAAVSQRDACSAPLRLQAPGTARPQAMSRHSTSPKPLSLRKDRKPNRELAGLLHAAAEVPPKDISSAPLYRGATRRAMAQSKFKPGLKGSAPSRMQARPEAPQKPKPKPMRGFRELAALHDGLVAQAAKHPRRRASVTPQQAETACPRPVPTNQAPAVAGQDSTPDRGPSGSRERQWAASGQPMGQLDRRATHRQTRRAGQLAAVQGRSNAQCTRGQDFSLGMHAPTGSSGRQILSSSKPRVHQTGKKESVGKAALAGQTKRHRPGHVMRGREQPARRLGHPVQASRVKGIPQEAGTAPARIARGTAAHAARASAASHTKAADSARGSAPRHAVPKRSGLAVKRTARQAPRATARTLAGLPHGQFKAAENLSSVADQGSGVPQRLDEAALRRSQRAAAGLRFRQTIKRAKDPLRAARAEAQQSKAAQGALLKQKAQGRSGQAEQPLGAAPTQEAAPLESGAGSCRGASGRPMRRASLGVQRLLDAYRLPWNALKPTTEKQPPQSVAGTLPSKRARLDQLPEDIEPHHKDAAVGSTPGRESEKAAELQAASTPSLVQGAGFPSTNAPRSPARSSMQHGWNLPAPEWHVIAPVRPQQVFSAPGLMQPLQIHSGAAASRHAAYVASRGNKAAPGIANPARTVLQEYSGIVKRARNQRTGTPGQKTSAQGRAKLPKQMRQATWAAAQGQHVIAPERSQPAGKRPRSNLAGRPSLPSQAEAYSGRENVAKAHTNATTPQSKASQNHTCRSCSPNRDAQNSSLLTERIESTRHVLHTTHEDSEYSAPTLGRGEGATQCAGVAGHCAKGQGTHTVAGTSGGRCRELPSGARQVSPHDAPSLCEINSSPLRAPDVLSSACPETRKSPRTPSLRCLAGVQCGGCRKPCPALFPQTALLWASDAHARFSVLPGGVQGAGGSSQRAAAGQPRGGAHGGAQLRRPAAVLGPGRHSQALP